MTDLIDYGTQTISFAYDSSLLTKFFLFFFVYSIGGWAFEKIYCRIVEGEFTKRGFLFGPYCPIYGFGAVLDITLLTQLNDALTIFIAGALVATILEYFTSLVLEKAFNTRWWDYSGMPFNLNGRIGLISSSAFGGFAVAVVVFINPALSAAMDSTSIEILTALATTLALLITIDIIFSLIKLNAFNSLFSMITNRFDNDKANQLQQRIGFAFASTQSMFSDTQMRLLEAKTNATRNFRDKTQTNKKFFFELKTNAIEKINEYRNVFFK